jgi:hypothetical protein
VLLAFSFYSKTAEGTIYFKIGYIAVLLTWTGFNSENFMSYVAGFWRADSKE